MTEQVEQKTASNFVFSLDFLHRNCSQDSGGRSCGQLVIGSFITQCAHTYITSRALFLVKHQITQVIQPQYGPDVAPGDFWLFPKLELPLKGKRFQTIDEIQENTTGQLMAIRRTA